MKRVILTLALLISNLSYSQIGVLTLKKNDNVQFGMWYTVDQKGRKNNLYITYDNEDRAIYKLEQLLSEFDLVVELPEGNDEYGNPYWTVIQDNGYISDIYYVNDRKNQIYTITIVSTKY
jgi:hypothetical protein